MDRVMATRSTRAAGASTPASTSSRGLQQHANGLPLLLMFFAVACGAKEPPPNIVLVLVDQLRKDATDSFATGHARNHTESGCTMPMASPIAFPTAGAQFDGVGVW